MLVAVFTVSVWPWSQLQHSSPRYAVCRPRFRKWGRGIFRRPWMVRRHGGTLQELGDLRQMDGRGFQQLDDIKANFLLVSHELPDPMASIQEEPICYLTRFPAIDARSTNDASHHVRTVAGDYVPHLDHSNLSKIESA